MNLGPEDLPDPRPQVKFEVIFQEQVDTSDVIAMNGAEVTISSSYLSPRDMILVLVRLAEATAIAAVKESLTVENGVETDEDTLQALSVLNARLMVTGMISSLPPLHLDSVLMRFGLDD